MSSVNKRKEEAMEETPTTKKTKLSRGARKRRNMRLKWELEHKEAFLELETDVSLTVTGYNIVFDLLRHRTQFATRRLCTKDKVHYIEKEWTSVPLCTSDRISSKEIKILQDITTRDLLIETLIREARITINPPKSFEIPPNFLVLIDSEIISGEETNDINKRLWIAIGRWLGLDESIKRRQVRRYLKSKWANLRHALDLRNDGDTPDMVNTRITRRNKSRLIMSSRDNFRSLDKLTKFRYITKPECITDLSEQTLIHLEQLNNQIAVTQATDAVNHYYFHTLEHPSHRSNEFWENFIEHFGAYARNNLLPFTSSNTASTHNSEHQECVDNLLRELVPLSNCINHFIQENYREMYTKLSNLTWGPFSPRPFGIFPMIAVNFNTISDFHWDEHDEPNSLCCLVALGDFEGGELCFPQLQIVIPLRPGQIVAFSSRLLLHGNFPITRGIRHSVVYFVHSMFFHHLRDFTDIYKDRKEGIERNVSGLVVPTIPRQDLNDARGLNRQVKLDKPKANQIRVPASSTDCRRGHIDLRRARWGLKAEDPLPDGL